MPTIDRSIVKQRQGETVRKLYSGGKPMLKVSYSAKSKNDFAHTKDLIDYYVSSTWFNSQALLSHDSPRNLHELYDAYNNNLSESYFNYVTNPLNSKRKEHSNFPARIRPYSIIRPSLDLIFGEFDKRPFNYTVLANNADAKNRMEETVYKSILKIVEQMFVNELNNQNVNTQVPSQETQQPAEAQAKIKSNYKDTRAEMGQAALQRVEQDCNINLQWQRMFKDWGIAGESYSLKQVRKGSLEYERISPLDIDYEKSPDTIFIEDANWVVRRRYMSAMDIVSMFYDELTDKDIDELEDNEGGGVFGGGHFRSLFTNQNSEYSEQDLMRSKFPVFHVTWKYYTKIGILNYEDEYGQPQQLEVPEWYKSKSNEKIEWIYTPEFWEAYRVDVGSDAKYLGIGPIANQRSAMGNFGICKGSYNGIRFSDTHSENVSLVSLGLPYEIFYRILHYRLEHTIAKSKGKIALIDKNAIPKDKGWDEEKFFYYAESMGFGLLNRNQIGADKSWNQYQVLDMGLYEHINNMISVMEFIKEEWNETIGITPQRRGQISANETATGVNAATYHSAIISERFFTIFDEFRRKELQGLLDLTKYTDLVGEKAIYHMDDIRQAFIDIDPVDYMNSEFGIYVSNSSQDIKELESLQSILPQMASQGNNKSEIIAMIQARNVSKLKAIMADMEEKEMKAAQQSEEKANEIEKRKLEIQKEFRAMEFQFDEALQNSKYNREDELAHIKGQYQLADTDQPGDTLDPVKVQESAMKATEINDKREAQKAEAQIKREKIQSDERIAEKKLKGERYKADKQLEVAKANKNQYDSKSKASK